MTGDPLDDGHGLTIVNEQLAELGGAERLVAALRDRFPRALLMGPSFHTTNLPGGTPADWSDPVRLVGSGGRRNPFLAPRHARRLAREDPVPGLLLTIGNNSWAHAVPPARQARHVAIVHGPPRCLYGHSRRYLAAEPPPLRPLLRAALPLLRSEYRRRLRAPHRRITVSHWSAGRLEEIHGVPWEVVHSPIDSALFTPHPAGRRSGGPVVISSRMVPHKYVDILIDAVRGLDVELVVVGGGPSIPDLRAAAPPNVRFTGWVEDHELRDIYRAASLFVSPTVEEFGIALGEAQASGLPVIAPADGGAREIVQEGVTGMLLPQLTPETLGPAIAAARAREWDSDACRRAALRFTLERFIAGIEDVLREEAEKLPDAVAPEPERRPAYA